MSIAKIVIDAKALEVEMKRITDNILDDSTMLEINQLFADTVYPWTPYVSGNLSSDVTVTADGVTYNAEYASDRYYGEVHCHDKHPLATSHWDDVAMQTEFDSFASQVKDILIRRAKDLYG